MDIFRDERDFLNFLKRLKIVLGMTRAPLVAQGAPLSPSSRINPLPDGSFTVLCYCLMPNHFHFLIRQNTDLPVSKLFSKVCTSYSMYFNRKYERVGTIFQDRFKSVHVANDSQLLWLSAYIHQNPKVAGEVANLLDYEWSSYPDYVGGRAGTLCEKSVILNQFPSPSDYQKFVESAFDPIKSRKTIEHLILD